VSFLRETPFELSLHHCVLSVDRRYDFHLMVHIFQKIPISPISPTSSVEVVNDIQELIGGSYNIEGIFNYDPMINDVVRPFLYQLRDSSESCSPPSSLGRLQPFSFRVVSYNIWNFNTHSAAYPDRMNKISDLILNEDPDIICLQEVRLDSSKSGSRMYGESFQLTDLRKKLPGYQFVYQPAMSYPDQSYNRVEEGLAIMSKYPIINYDYILLPKESGNPDDFHQRICLHAEVELPDSRHIHLFVTHLSLDEKAQIRSVKKIWKFMQQFDTPALFMGDLNNEPDSKPIQFLSGDIELNGIKTTLRDVWLMKHSEPRKVGNEENEAEDPGLTFPTDNPIKRIDFIFLKDDQNELTPDRIDTFGKVGHHMASDHLGLSADFTFVHCK